MAALALTALAACSSRYDWHTVTDATGAYSVSYPGKVSEDAQSIEINGQSLPMRMQTAAADNIVFAVGSVPLPAGQAALSAATLDFMQEGISRNVTVPSSTQQIEIPLADGTKIQGREWRSDGEVAGTTQGRSITARFFATSTHAYEIVVVGESKPKADLVKRFFDSFKPS